MARDCLGAALTQLVPAAGCVAVAEGKSRDSSREGRAETKASAWLLCCTSGAMRLCSELVRSGRAEPQHGVCLCRVMCHDAVEL